MTMTDPDIATQIAQLRDALEARDAELTDLRGKLAERDSAVATQAAVDAAIEPVAKELAEVKDKLEKETMERGKAEAERDGLKQLISDEAEKANAAERRDERVEAVKATNAFPADAFEDEGLVTTSLADEWAAIADEAWPAKLAEYTVSGAGRTAATAKTTATPDNGELPAGRSAMQDAATVDGDEVSPARKQLRSMYATPARTN